MKMDSTKCTIKCLACDNVAKYSCECCDYVYYCNTECKDKSWENHKDMCLLRQLLNHKENKMISPSLIIY